MAKKVAITTLGCKVNQYESEAIMELFVRAGYIEVSFTEKADVYIVNTCTVTHLSDRKSRQMIRRAKQENPHSLLVVMGCYAQTNPEGVMELPGVDIVIGTKDRHKILQAVENAIDHQETVSYVEALEKDAVFEPLTIDGSSIERTRAFMKVQDGCNQFCSYCIIPYARGRIRSRSIEDSVKEAYRLVKAGFTELVLTGIHLASWGKDSGEGTLLDLLSALSAVPGLKRIRLGSLEPTLCDAEFVAGVEKLSKVCHHFHLSLQSGCDETLKRMNRNYTTREYEDAVIRLRNKMPDAAITTDIIVGFPGETEEEFLKTVSFVEHIGLADAHIFKYSPRKGTKAASMQEQINPQIKEKRSQTLIAVTHRLKDDFARKFLGEEVEVLFEQPVENGYFEGKMSNYQRVLVPYEEGLEGCYKEVLIETCRQGTLYGKLL